MVRSLDPPSVTLRSGIPELARGIPSPDPEVRQRLRQLAPGGGYCVGSSNSIANYVPLANYRAMIAATQRWGKYPISA